jgi:SsrA-binding protein
MTTFADNRQARFNYEILEHLTAGIELLGAEVKSVRAGRMSLTGAYVIIRGGEAFLTGANIAPYQAKNTSADFEPERLRRLLLSKKELESLVNYESTKGLTIVPLTVYNKGRYIKVDIAIGRGKKKFDKRETLKKRDTERDLKRTL